VIREQLVERLAAVHGALLGMRAAEEHRSGSGVIGARIGSLAAGHRMGEVADDRQAIAQLLERLQRLGEGEAAAFRCRHPLVHRRAMRNVDAAEAALRQCGGLHQRGARRDHRVEQRQRESHAHSAKERAAGKMLLRDEHVSLRAA
jgi:hypothetical protein